MEERVRSEFVDGVLCILESRLEKIVLYGSVARGSNIEGSDVDIALVMHGKLDADHFRTWLEVLPFLSKCGERRNCVMESGLIELSKY